MKSSLLLLVALGAAAPAPAQTPPKLPFSVDGLPIGAIPPQELPQGSCAAFLWTRTNSHGLVAMMTANPARIRFAPGGTITDLVRVSQQGSADFGFSTTTDYAGGDFRLSIEIEIAKRKDLSDGATIPVATIRIDREGQDTVIVPAVGLIGCG